MRDLRIQPREKDETRLTKRLATVAALLVRLPLVCPLKRRSSRKVATTSNY